MANTAINPYVIKEKLDECVLSHELKKKNSYVIDTLKLTVSKEIIKNLLLRHIKFCKTIDDGKVLTNTSLIWPFKEHRNELLDILPPKLFHKLIIHSESDDSVKFKNFNFDFTYKNFNYILTIYSLIFYKNSLKFKFILDIDNINILNDLHALWIHYDGSISYDDDDDDDNNKKNLHIKFNKYINDSVKAGCNFE